MRGVLLGGNMCDKKSKDCNWPWLSRPLGCTQMLLDREPCFGLADGIVAKSTWQITSSLPRN
eukprot:14260241-Alexandrium_andersonii.AAC.1